MEEKCKGIKSERRRRGHSVIEKLQEAERAPGEETRQRKRNHNRDRRKLVRS